MCCAKAPWQRSTHGQHHERGKQHRRSGPAATCGEGTAENGAAEWQQETAFPSLVEEEAGGGEAGQRKEAEDGGVERRVGLDHVKDGVLVGVLKDGAHLQSHD